VHPRLRLVDPLLGAVYLIALALMSLASALPFLQIPVWGGLQTGNQPQPDTFGTSEHLTLDSGFYLFLGSATVAIGASLIMVVTSTVRLRRRQDLTMTPIAVG
jgi:hypothetical protein